MTFDRTHTHADELACYLDGSLSAERAWGLERHVAACSSCSLQLERTAQLEETLHHAAATLATARPSHSRAARFVPLAAAAAAYMVWLATGTELASTAIRVGESSSGETVDESICALPDESGATCGADDTPLLTRQVDEPYGTCEAPWAASDAGAVCEVGAAGLFTPIDG